MTTPPPSPQEVEIAMKIADSARALTKPLHWKDYGASIDFKISLLPHLAVLAARVREQDAQAIEICRQWEIDRARVRELEAKIADYQYAAKHHECGYMHRSEAAEKENAALRGDLSKRPSWLEWKERAEKAESLLVLGDKLARDAEYLQIAVDAGDFANKYLAKLKASWAAYSKARGNREAGK